VLFAFDFEQRIDFFEGFVFGFNPVYGLC
jgi:hypothetical protein